jgi:putative restriction endonuclease
MRRDWTREETILAFELYCTIPSKDVTAQHPLIISLAQKFNRTPNSIKLKLQNFKSFDPSYTADGRVGLSHGSKLDEQIANEFLNNWDKLSLEADKLKTEFELSDNIDIERRISPTGNVGYNKIVNSTTRIGQTFFRNSVLASYEKCCCITGLNFPELLRASHIKPWAKSDTNEKVNPQNGLLLNALHDSAFDKGFITISFDYEIVVSSEIKKSNNTAVSDYILKYSGDKITLPSRFVPSREFIEYHNDVVFRG